jgi:glycosyltransferase involved in cell wall biosynthesis
MKVSVIIPVKDEEGHIADLLDSLFMQSQKPDEIIIADGGSSDNTIRIIETYLKKGMPIKVIKAGQALPGKGRNVAIANASNSVIAMTDGGIILDKDWLRNIISPFETAPSTEVVYGAWTYIARTLFEKCFAVVYVRTKRNVKGVFGNSHFLASMAIKKHIWERIGGFREDLRATEDLVFLEAIHRIGAKAVEKEDAVVYWRPHSSFAETSHLAFKYAACGALTNFHTARYLRKTLVYAVGALLLVFAAHDPFWIAILLFGFILNVLVVCKKNWTEFIKITISNVLAFPAIALIMLTLDLSNIAGFWKGVLAKLVPCKRSCSPLL